MNISSSRNVTESLIHACPAELNFMSKWSVQVVPRVEVLNVHIDPRRDGRPVDTSI